MASSTESPYAAVIDTPVGRLGVLLGTECLAAIDWVTDSLPLRAPGAGLARCVVEQLGAYFDDPVHTHFDLPLVPVATAFQARVRAALQAIPAGEVRCYGELAKALGSSARAVGGACRANPVPLVVPCHRVVAAHGLGGFGGATAGKRLSVKQRLLEGEGVSCASIT